MSANNYTAASGKCAFGFSPLPEISGISIVMYVSELFVDGNCIIGSLVRRTFTRGAIRFLCYSNLSHFSSAANPQISIRSLELFTLNEIRVVRRSFARRRH